MTGNPFNGTHADPPQRYLGNYSRYLARGGRVNLADDLRGFTAEGMNRRDMARFHFFSLAFDQICKEEIAGDLAEIGVYQGHTATLLATMARRLDRTAWLFDTFEGFDAADLQGIDAGKKMQFADTSLEAVQRLVGEANVRFVKGHVPGSLAHVPDDARFCLVHIDCDLYAPISAALAHFYPRLVPGGFLVIHDYSSLAWDGAERAVDEFFADKLEAVIPVTDGQGSVAIRKARRPGRDPDWLLRQRIALFGPDWRRAGANGLGAILGAGWSEPEAWGVWGIGARHELSVFLPQPPTAPVWLEADAHALLGGAHQSQIVDVACGGTLLAEWPFDETNNRAIRRVRLPPGAFASVGTDAAAAAIEFRPRTPLAPADITPGHADTRRLGLALHRIRRGADD